MSQIEWLINCLSWNYFCLFNWFFYWDNMVLLFREREGNFLWSLLPSNMCTLVGSRTQLICSRHGLIPSKLEFFQSSFLQLFKLHPTFASCSFCSVNRVMRLSFLTGLWYIIYLNIILSLFVSWKPLDTPEFKGFKSPWNFLINTLVPRSSWVSNFSKL